MLNQLFKSAGLFIGIGLTFIGALLFFQFYPDLLWFNSFNLNDLWWFVFKTKLLAFSAGFALTFLWLSLNFKIVSKYSDTSILGQNIEFNTPFTQFNNVLRQLWANTQRSQLSQIPNSLNKFGTRAAILILSVIFGLTFRAKWQDFLYALNQTSYGTTDPLFGHDISFYFFSLPVLRHLQGWLFSLIFISIVIVGWTYLSRNILFLIFSKHQLSGAIRKHIGILLGLLVTMIGIGTFLGGYDLLFSQKGVVFGAGYTDINVLLPTKYILTLIWFLEALLIFLWAFNGSLLAPVVGIAMVFIVNILGNGFIPNIIQSYVVSPNELNKERDYIEHNISYTRNAYNLDKIETQEFPVNNTLTAADILNNKQTINNIRLWNQEPLKQTFSQLQEIRLYYEFANIDVDRYTVDGQLQQVMLSPREMDVNQLTAQGQTWINRRLVYTHGFGAVMSPVNEISNEGLPIFYIKDLPASSTIETKITRPEIYFGEKTNDYVIVNTKQQEFNYPKGDTNVYTNYQGSGGIQLDSFFKRLALAISLSDIKILVSSPITSESRLLVDRQIRTITRKIAPFLAYDRDPYMVITDEGRIVWVQDAYTYSDTFPYSEPVTRGVNYIRNSAKITIDAYTGETNFYVVDETDPFIKTIQNVYPNLFKDMDDMPDNLRDHLRYPKDLFSIQAQMLSTYHMKDPQVFYNREDLWAIPKETYGESEQTMKPYYMVTKLPGEPDPTFILMLPFTPTNKNNMIAWMAVRSDSHNYGEATVFKFPKERTIYGPMQIESRIDQDTDISQKLTLWGQVGSRVIRGNLMVVPIEDSLVYVEPIYLQATQSKLPELKRVIFGYDDSITMAETLPDAINDVFSTSLRTKAQDAKVKVAKTLESPIEKVKETFNELKTSVKNLEWSKFGEKMDELDQWIEKL